METFAESGLQAEILTAIAELGFETPTPIQKETIPQILESQKDLVALAQTGTGKTAAFGLPVLNQTDISNSNTQTLILCPTRELCMQINSDMEKYAKNIREYRQVAVYGGASIENQIRTLKKGCHTVVATPGRALDLIRRKVLKLDQIRWLILDEADEMLRMGFKEDLDAILSETPPERQTLLFSATMPKEIASIASNYMKNPREISVGKRNAGAEHVRHEFYMVQARNRYLALKRIIDINPNIYGIVFCRTRQETKDVADKLMQDGYSADALHGDLSQAQRDYVMNRFRVKNLQLLVATDVAARGLDVNNLTHVLNYNLPDDLEVYTHRSGRTGRAGNKGISISIIHSRETSKIRNLEQTLKKKIERKPVPTGEEVCEKQLFKLVDRVERTEVNPQIEQYLPDIYKKLSWLERDDLIKHFISVEFNRFLEYYKNAPDLNVSEQRSTRNAEDRKSKRGKGNYSRFFINLGSKNGIDAPAIIGLINQYSRKRRIEIGKIDIMKKFSFFEVESEYEDLILSGFKKAQYKGMSVAVELSKPDTNQNSSDAKPHKKKIRKAKRKRI